MSRPALPGLKHWTVNRDLARLAHRTDYDDDWGTEEVLEDVLLDDVPRVRAAKKAYLDNPAGFGAASVAAANRFRPAIGARRGPAAMQAYLDEARKYHQRLRGETRHYAVLTRDQMKGIRHDKLVDDYGTRRRALAEGYPSSAARRHARHQARRAARPGHAERVAAVHAAATKIQRAYRASSSSPYTQLGRRHILARGGFDPADHPNIVAGVRR